MHRRDSADGAPLGAPSARRRGSPSPTRRSRAAGGPAAGAAAPARLPASPTARLLPGHHRRREARGRVATVTASLALALVLALALASGGLLFFGSGVVVGVRWATTTTTTATATAARATAATASARHQQQHPSRTLLSSDDAELQAAAAFAIASAAETTAPPPPPPPPPAPPRLLDLAARCHGAEGGWCAAFYTQRPLRPRAPPLAGKRCGGGGDNGGGSNGDCSGGLGVCHADAGRCDCPAGWRGKVCGRRDPRPCTNRYRARPGDPSPASHIGPDGADLDLRAPGFTYSRCGGACDADTGACYCGAGSAHGRLPAPAGSPPGTPPLREGRPLGIPCAWLATDRDGKPLGWGGPKGVPWESLYGPRGWCEVSASSPSEGGGGEAATTTTAAPPAVSCGCALDGRGGALCDLPAESFCPNQCSGHGECARGFCRCAEGWYGLDCARKAAWAPKEEEEGEGEGEGEPAGQAVGAAAAAAADAKSSSSSRSGLGGPPPLLPHDADVVGERPWLAEVTVDPWSRSQVPPHAVVEAAAEDTDAAAAASAAAAAPRQPEQQQQLALALEDDLFASGGGGDPASLTAAALREALGHEEDEEEEGGTEDQRAGGGQSSSSSNNGRRRLARYFWAGAGAGPWRPPSRRGHHHARRRPPILLDAVTASSSSAAAVSGGGFVEGGAGGWAGLQEWGGLSLASSSRRRASATRARPQRLRPRIFVYDMPAPFVSRMLQYRTDRERCTWRVFGSGQGHGQQAQPANDTAAPPAAAVGPGGLRGGAALNASDFSAYAYPTESLLHELLLRSEHRTLDPEEADLFYVPFYASCFVDGVFGAADAPWWLSPSKSRVKGASVMAAQALEWVRSSYPYWDRRNGSDHVWLFSHDEGACWAPAEVLARSLVLTHWGRVGGGKGGWARGGKATALPVSEARDPQLNYTINIGDDPRLGPGGKDLLLMAEEGRAKQGSVGGGKSAPPALPPASSWHEALSIGTQPCYDASSGRHLVIPAFRPPPHYHGSPFLGAPEPRNAPRDVLLLLRGEMGVEWEGEEGDEEGDDKKGGAASSSSSKWRATRPPSFSRGVRQRLARAARAGRWRERHNVWIGGPRALARHAARAAGGVNATALALAAAAAAEAEASSSSSSSSSSAAYLAGAAGAAVAAATSADGDYSRLLARSVFCLVAPGDGGWTGLFEDAVLHGCVPVWMTDGVRPPFDGALRWRDFALEVREADAERLPELLLAVPAQRVAEMQRRLALLWHRFAWLSHPLLRRAADEGLLRNHRRGEWIVPALKLHSAAARRRPAVGLAPGVAPALEGGGGALAAAGVGGAETAAAAAASAVGGGPERWVSPLSPGEAQDDAFATILQWLYSRMPPEDADAGAVAAQARQEGGSAAADDAVAAAAAAAAAARAPPHRRAVAPWELAAAVAPSAAEEKEDPDAPTLGLPDLELESDGPFADEGPGGWRGDGGGADDDVATAVLTAAAIDADALELALWDGRPLLDDGRGGAYLTRHGVDPQRERAEKAEAKWAAGGGGQEGEGAGLDVAAAIAAAGTANAGGDPDA